jgi:hypothetical protein
LNINKDGHEKLGSPFYSLACIDPSRLIADFLLSVQL